LAPELLIPRLRVTKSANALFQRICKLDLEGIVSKQKFGPYVTEREQSTWFKILNRAYSQMAGRGESSVNAIRSLLQDGTAAR
jgi:ATP-dependent DNA ligase